MKPYIQPRPKTAPAEQVLLDLLHVIRDQFYLDEKRPQFYPHLKDLKRVITWPASWLNDRAIFVSPERYREILLDIIQGVKRHGQTDKIKYWPFYLLTCIQRHFSVHAQDYVTEGKAARDLVTRVVANLPAPAADPGDQFVRDLATAHALLKSPGRRHAKKEKETHAPVQQHLF